MDGQDAIDTHSSRGAADDWTLKDTVQLVDALIDSGLLVQSIGPRPVVCLTRAGHRALDALDLGGES
jgi:hypothetical protein